MSLDEDIHEVSKALAFDTKLTARIDRIAMALDINADLLEALKAAMLALHEAADKLHVFGCDFREESPQEQAAFSASSMCGNAITGANAALAKARDNA